MKPFFGIWKHTLICAIRLFFFHYSLATSMTIWFIMLTDLLFYAWTNVGLFQVVFDNITKRVRAFNWEPKYDLRLSNIARTWSLAIYSYTSLICGQIWYSGALFKVNDLEDVDEHFVIQTNSCMDVDLNLCLRRKQFVLRGLDLFWNRLTGNISA